MSAPGILLWNSRRRALPRSIGSRCWNLRTNCSSLKQNNFARWVSDSNDGDVISPVVQEVAILEENLDKSISQEENFGSSDMSDDVVSLQRKLRDQGVELEQLRKKLSEMDIKHARTIHDVGDRAVRSPSD